MTNAEHVTIARLKALVVYDPEAGTFWPSTGRQGCRQGQQLGGIDMHGYRRIMIDGRKYKAHRLAWLYVHGVWPIGDIDHINGCRSDNRIANLREATRSQNRANSRLRADNRCGLKGVSRFNERWWRAHIRVRGKMICLGYFKTKEEAAAAYTSAAREHFGEFARVS